MRRLPARATRLLAGVVAVVAVTVPAVGAQDHDAAAVASSATTTIDLSGTLHLVGARPGVIRLVVPEGASLDLSTTLGGDPAGVEIEGDGRLVGFHLALDDPTSRDGVLVLRLPQQVASIGYHRHARLPGPGCDTTTTVCHLPAGAYLLYLVADGSPVRVSLAFAGVDGEQHVCATGHCPDGQTATLTPVGHHIATPEVSDASPLPGFAYRSASVEETYHDSAVRLLLAYGAAYSDTLPPPGPGGSLGASLDGACVYRGPTPPQGVQPGCVDSTQPGAGAMLTVLPGDDGKFGSWGYASARWQYRPEDGLYTMGGWQVAAGAADVFGVATLRLDLPATG